MRDTQSWTMCSFCAAFNSPLPGHQYPYLENESDEGYTCPGCDLGKVDMFKAGGTVWQRCRLCGAQPVFLIFSLSVAVKWQLLTLWDGPCSGMALARSLWLWWWFGRQEEEDGDKLTIGLKVQAFNPLPYL